MALRLMSRRYDPVAKRKSNLRCRYGIEIETYEAMHRAAKGRCAVCGRKVPLVVDHDHSDMSIRGLICSRDNRAIGLLGDSAENLRKALSYLEKHDEKHERRRVAG